jgi:segregation and condensation protein B
VSDDLVACCEALLFIAEEPLAVHELAAAAEIDEESVEAALLELERRLAERGAGVILDRAAGRYGLRAAPGGPAEAASRLQARAPERGLSPAALEALAVVAYLQPIGRPEIARIRGVSSDAVVAGLLERELIEEAGRGDGLGTPVLYRTTTTFERVFGLEEGLGGLPGLDGHDELESAELRRRLHAVAAERG